MAWYSAIKAEVKAVGTTIYFADELGIRTSGKLNTNSVIVELLAKYLVSNPVRKLA